MMQRLKDELLSSIKDLQNGYFYIAPSLELSNYILKYTITFAKKTTISENITLIPDGSGCLIFTFDGSSLSSTLWGAATKTFVVENDMHRYPMQLYIELLPGGLYFLTGVNQSKLTNMQIPLWQIDNNLYNLVASAFENAKNLNAFINQLNIILLDYIQRRNLPAVLLSAVANIKQTKGCLSVKEISEREFYSSRHLNRLFNEYLGMNVKTFSNIIRINEIITMLNSGNRLSINIAHTTGFYDQAHFIHTFKSLCGTTPGKFI